MADTFQSHTHGPEAPALDFDGITPSDTVNLDYRTRAIYVGGAGDIVAINRTGDAVTFATVPAGSIIPIRTDRVNSTGTTATGLVALW